MVDNDVNSSDSGSRRSPPYRGGPGKPAMIPQSVLGGIAFINQ